MMPVRYVGGTTDYKTYVVHFFVDNERGCRDYSFNTDVSHQAILGCIKSAGFGFYQSRPHDRYKMLIAKIEPLTTQPPHNK
jgi:hypothetical protein